MQSDPKLSVVMCVHNGQRHLRESVGSILNQTFGSFEFIIIDDASKDKTARILNEFAQRDLRIKVITHKDQLGVSASLNKALGLSKGSYVARMEVDDISLPERFAKQVGLLDKNAELGLVGTCFIKLNEKGEALCDGLLPSHHDDIKNYLFTLNAYCNGSVMFKKNYVEQVGCYDETLKYHQDYDLWTKVSEVCLSLNIPEKLQKKRENTQTQNSEKELVRKRQCENVIKKANINRKFKAGAIDYAGLRKLACAKPKDSVIASFFFQEHERLKKTNIDDVLIYYILKFFHGDMKEKYLNQIAEIYMKQNRRSLAHMCLVESLRLNSQQSQIFEMAESLSVEAQPKYPKVLKDNKYEVSIIMPTYNRAEEIRESIDSVLNQTFQDFELIIVNDGGSDGIENIIVSYNSSKIKYYKLNVNQGPAVARNEAILKAEGKYITFLDDDDVYYPHHLEVLVKGLEESGQKIAYAAMKMVKGNIQDGMFVPEFVVRDFECAFSKEDLVINRNSEPVSFMFHKSVFADVGLFNKDLVMGEDCELLLRISLKFDFYEVSETTREWRIKHNNSVVQNVINSNFLDPLYQCYHLFYQGKVAAIKYYILKQDSRNARDLYADIQKSYVNLPKAPLFYKELLPIIKYFNDKYSLRKLVKKYFRLEPKICLRALLSHKLFLSFFDILPLLPASGLIHIKKFAKRVKKIFIREYHLLQDKT